MLTKSKMRWSVMQEYFRMPPLLPLKMMSEESAQKFHTDDVSLPSSG